MNSKVKVSLNILPFGSIRFESPEVETPAVETEPNELPSQYIEPLTTSIGEVEILYEGREVYIVPKTTAGTV